MRRLLALSPGQLAWDEGELPPPGPGQVLIRTRLSAVSVSSELSVRRGLPGHAYPSRLGYQTLGVVQEAGPQVELRVGQRVVCLLGHASHGVVSTSRVIPVPDGVPDRVALCSILGEETHKGIRKVGPEAHERVLVAGAGLLGLLTLFNLTRRGIGQVSVLEPDAHRRERARLFGAAEVYAPDSLPQDGFDVGFECSASPAGFAEHLRPGGRCCVLSDGNWGALTLPPEFHARELRVVASSDGEDYHAYARWLWGNADPVLEQLFELEVTPDELIPTFDRLARFPRPVSVLVNWAAST